MSTSPTKTAPLHVSAETLFGMMVESRMKAIEETLSENNHTINHQAERIQRLKNECHTMRQETEKLKLLNKDFQFYLYSKAGGSDILAIVFRFKQNTPRLTNILDYQAYVNKLIRNLLVYGYCESVDKINKCDCFPLTNPEEEHVLRLIIQETIDSSILGSISFEQTFDSPSLSILSQLHMISLKERKLLVSNLERRMQALKVDSYCSKSQLLAQYKDIEQKLRKYSIPGETIGSGSAIYYAFKSLEQSRRYRGWSEKYKHNFQTIDIIHSPFVDLDDLFKKAKWEMLPDDFGKVSVVLALVGICIVYIKRA
ncbi:unnamed protein product [Ambrosiozyma monospora]|uniref:Unnamed protein product n=1 Tax=Ambrosiozyma monospora TaxID=43982 RepID=A0A9W7DK08_AMBMO|nr:unnamed protein product [Ambrosiozyma monospora]